METIYPYNEDAERSVIGSVIIEPDLYAMLAIEAKHFYVHKNRYIWEAITELVNSNKAIDFVTISDQINEAGKTKDVEPAYIVSIINNVASSMNAEYYAEIIKKYYARRKVLAAASDLAIYAQKDDIAPADLMVSVNDIFAGIQDMNGGEQPVQHISELIKDVYGDIAKAYDDPRSIWGMATGYEDFDILLGGIQQGDLIYFIGSPGAGKSILTLNLALGLLSNNYPGAIFSLEMTSKSQIMRAMSAMSEVSTRRMRTGKLEADDWTSITKAFEKLSQKPLYITDSIMTLPELHAKIKYLKSQFGIKWVLVDYLLLLQGYDKLSETERSSMLSAGIKRIIKTENVAGMVINAVTKAEYAIGSTPGLADMRGSSMVAHDADIVAHVKRIEDENVLRLYFTKLRDVSRVEGRAIDFVAEVNYPKVRTPKKIGMAAIARAI